MGRQAKDRLADAAVGVAARKVVSILVQLVDVLCQDAVLHLFRTDKLHNTLLDQVVDRNQTAPEAIDVVLPQQDVLGKPDLRGRIPALLPCDEGGTVPVVKLLKVVTDDAKALGKAACVIEKLDLPERGPVSPKDGGGCLNHLAAETHSPVLLDEPRRVTRATDPVAVNGDDRKALPENPAQITQLLKRDEIRVPSQVIHQWDHLTGLADAGVDRQRLRDADLFARIRGAGGADQAVEAGMDHPHAFCSFRSLPRLVPTGRRSGT